MKLNKKWNELTTSVPETIVQVTIPTVIINTDKYLENSYCFFKIIIPIIMLAMSEP